MSKRTTRQRCPHCGNTNPGLIEDNGLPARDDDYTLLCVARVERLPGKSWDTRLPEVEGA